MIRVDRKGRGLMARVLVVDDDAAIRQLLTFAFTMEGHLVETLSDGRGVIAALREASERIIVLMDVMMPHMDGLEVCCLLAEESALAARHAVVLMSAGLPPDANVPLVTQGTLAKPFNLERALRLVERLAAEPAALGISETQPADMATPARMA
jgi:two-component system, OmpR family, response regulator